MRQGNTTRTVEIEVCGTCGDDVTESRSYQVEVSFSEPHGWPEDKTIERFGAAGHQHTTHGPLKEYEYRGQFCADCSDRIQEVLLAAGLSKHAKPQSRYVAVLDNQ
jgi:hypothetical protein